MTTAIPPMPPLRTLTYIDPTDFIAYRAAWNARDAAQTARIAELEAQLDPAPEPAGTVFGVNASPGQEEAYTDLLHPKALRYYFQAGELPVYPLPNGDWPLGPDQFLVTSHKIIDITVDQLVAYYRQLPTDRTTYDCGWHEPGTELGLRTTAKPVFTKAQYDALYVRMRQAQQQVGDHIKIMPILEGIAFLAGNDPDDELPSDPSTYDAIGVDPYFAGSIGQPWANVDSVLAAYKKAADDRGKPWAVCETGIGVKYFSGQVRNDALTQLGQKLRAAGALFVCYFLGRNNVIQWSLSASDGSRDAWVAGQK